MILPTVKQQTPTGDTYPVPKVLTCSFEGEHGALGANTPANFEPRVTLTDGVAYIHFAFDGTLDARPEIYRVRVEGDAIHVGYRDARGAVNGAATVALLLRKGELEQGFEVVNAYYPYTYTFMEHYLTPEKMKTRTPYTTPEQPAERAAQMLGGEFCVWGAEPFNHYVTPAALAVFGDKLRALGERAHNEPYKIALAEYLFGDASLVRVFDCMGDIIPPRTGEFFTYLAPEQINKALVTECVAALREQKQSYLTRAYIDLLEKIVASTGTARTQTKKDLEE